MCQYCQSGEELSYTTMYLSAYGDTITVREQEAVNGVVDNLNIRVNDCEGAPTMQIDSDKFISTLRGYSRVGKCGNDIDIDPEIAVKIPIKYCPMCGKKLGEKKRELTIDERVMKNLFGL